MIPVLPAQWDWPSAIGNFILNYGVLDWHMLVFLKARLRADDFTRIKGKPFRERVAMVKSLLASAPQSQAQCTAIDKLFIRLEPIRELRNQIAHGHLLCRSAEAAKAGKITLSLPKDLDANLAPETRHLEFAELAKALTELTGVIEEFKTLCGGWTEEELDA